MGKPNRFSTLELLFIIFLFISQIYYGYRWPFQYSSEGTSPTYSNTPFIFQALKYFFAVLIFVASFALLATQKQMLGRITNAAYVFFLLLAGFCAYSLTIDTMMMNDLSGFGNTAFLKGFFFLPLLALMPFFYRGQGSIKAYFWVIVVFGFGYHLIYSLFQVFCYLVFDRLPALGYHGGLVRFGGGWDDPNGFAAYLILPLLVFISKMFVRGTSRYAGLFFLFLLLALTSSVTGIIGLICSVLFYSAMKRRFVIFFVLAPIIVSFALSPDLQDVLAFVLEAKSKSIESHLQQFSVAEFFQTTSMMEWFLGRHVVGGTWNESYYLALLQNDGIIGLLWFGAIILTTLANAVRKALAAERLGDRNSAETYIILGAFIFGFSAAALVTPAFYVFPVNLYCWLAVFVIWLTPSSVKSHAIHGAIRAPMVRPQVGLSEP